MRLVPSKKEGKKWDAVFDDGKVVSFGAAGYEDYTMHRDEERRERYRKRHAKDLGEDVRTPGYLSYYVLWGDSTSRQKNLLDYQRRFGVD
jgi:hypothetical protein